MKTNIFYKLMITCGFFFVLFAASKTNMTVYEQLQGTWESEDGSYIFIIFNDTWVETKRSSSDEHVTYNVTHNTFHKFILSDKRDIPRAEITSELKKKMGKPHNGEYLHTLFDLELCLEEGDSECQFLYFIEISDDLKSLEIGYHNDWRTTLWHRVEKKAEVDLVKKAREENIKGEAAYNRKDYSQAIDHFVRARVADERNARAYLNISLVAIKRGFYRPAIENAKKGILYSSSDREKGMGYYNIGLANEKLGREKVALENYRKSYELHKNERVLEKITELESNPTSPQ